MTIANYITYIILIFGLILCFYKPKTAFLLLMATQFTRITIPLGLPRLASPLFFEIVLLLIIYIKMPKKYQLAKIIKNSKLLVIWVFSHIGFRLIHILVYDDITSAEGDIINFYFKIFLLYSIIINLFSGKYNFNLLVRCLQFNLLFIISFIYIEYFFSITYGQIFNILNLSVDEMITDRYGQGLIRGPYLHWTLTGMVVVTSLPLFIVDGQKINLKKLFILLFFLFTVIIIGSRGAIVSALFLMLILVLTNFSIKNIFAIIVVLLSIPSLLFFSYWVVDLLQESFTLTYDPNNAGYNITVRMFTTMLLLKNIFSVPFIGYAWRMRPFGPVDDMPLSSYDMESNLFIKDIYDFGLILGCITIIWFLKSAFFRMKQQI